MKKRSYVILGTCLAVLTLSLVLNQSVTFAQSEVPYVEPSPCPIEVPEDADLECGYLVAPENYAEPDGRLIRMPYIILHTKSPDPNQVPLLFTEGGPGGESLQSVWGFKDSVLLKDRDIIIFEQRGNLYADPVLACTMDGLFDKVAKNSPCLEKIKSDGIDLQQYTTAVLAEDIETLRLTLGIEQWNLFGTSYSTRLMQVLMDRHPDGIRSVILQSTNLTQETRFQRDPEHSYRALHVMFEDCAADSDCASVYPNLEERFFILVAELNQNPIDLTLENPGDGSPRPYQISGDTLINWMVGRAFYGPAFPPYITAAYPLLIDQLSQGNDKFLNVWAQNEIENDLFSADFIAYGLYFAVNCQDDAASVTQAEIEALGAAFPQMDGFYRHWDEWQVCQLWDLPPAAPLTDGPVVSELPTLVLAGRYDPITPTSWSRTAAENLPNSFYVEFPSKGHSLDIGSTCAEEIKRSFLQDPWREPDTSCLVDEPKPTFILASNKIMPADGFVRSWHDINFGVPQGNSTFEFISGVSLVVCLVEFLAFLVLSYKVLSARSERSQQTQRLAYIPHLLAGITSALSIASILLMSQAAKVMSENETLIELTLFEMTPTVIALGFVVLAQILCGLVLVLLLIRVWLVRQSTLLNRIALTLVSLSTCVFWFFYFRWDFVTILFN